MTEPIAAGTLVELSRVVLAAGERAPNVPPETQRVPLEMRVRGTLADEASAGDVATVVTAAGRRVSGELVAPVASPPHSFGPPVPELVQVGAELRAVLAGGEAGR